MTKETIDSQYPRPYTYPQPMNQFTIRFQLFGIPIEIHPSIFLILLILGGGLSMEDAGGLIYTLLFIVAGLLCLLSHELGHAFAAKFGYGASTSIILAWTGGLTSAHPAPPTRGQSLAMTIAGPLGTLVPGIVAVLLLGLQLGGDFSAAWRLMAYFSLPFTDGSILSNHLSEASMTALEKMPVHQIQFYSLLCGIGVFWAFFNLLPIYPLDGGQVMMELTNKPRLCGWVGVVTCLVAGLALSIWTASAFNAMIFLLLAWYNYRLARS